MKSLWIVSLVLMLATSCTQGEVANVGNESSEGDQEILYELMGVCAKGNVEEVRRLVDGPASALVNTQLGEGGETPVHRAAEFHQLDVVELLLARGADPNIANGQRNTPLHAASFKGYGDIVRVLLAHGANPNVSESEYGMTPLIMASWKGHKQVVELLLAAHASVNARAKDGSTAMSRASQARHTEIVVLLQNVDAQ